jgi:hypothetical protein
MGPRIASQVRCLLMSIFVVMVLELVQLVLNLIRHVLCFVARVCARTAALAGHSQVALDPIVEGQLEIQEWAFCGIESRIPVPKTQSIFHPHAQRAHPWGFTFARTREGGKGRKAFRIANSKIQRFLKLVERPAGRRTSR